MGNVATQAKPNEQSDWESDPEVHLIFHAAVGSPALQQVHEAARRYENIPPKRQSVFVGFSLSETGWLELCVADYPASLADEIGEIDDVIVFSGTMLRTVEFHAPGDEASALDGVRYLLTLHGLTPGQPKRRWVGFDQSETGWLDLYRLDFCPIELSRLIGRVPGVTAFDTEQLLPLIRTAVFDVPDGSAAMAQVTALFERYGLLLGERQKTTADYELSETGWLTAFWQWQMPVEAAEALRAIDGVTVFSVSLCS